MSNQRSVGKFCSIVVSTVGGTSDSIATLVGSALGEGALAWCIAQNAAYRWTATVLTAQTPEFVPAPGSVGTWVLQQGTSATILGSSAAMTFTGQGDFIASVQNDWNAMATGASFYLETLTPTGGNWTLNTTNGVRTYSGIARAFLVTCSVTVIPSGANALFELDIDLNGTRIGGAANGSITSQVANLPNANSVSITQSCVINVTPGDTWQHIWRVTSALPPILAFQRYNSNLIAL